MKLKLNNWLKQNYALKTGETQYLNISPKIIVENYLVDENNLNDIVDYQFWCFNGEVNLINSHIYFLKNNELKICRFFYNLEYQLLFKDNLDFEGKPNIKEPKSLSQMIEYAKILSSGLPFARIDFYEVNSKPIFGEITLTPSGGNNHYFSHDKQIELGNLIDLTILESMEDF
jgi:hypothetical protein